MDNEHQNNSRTRHLVIGGTGMLMPYCLGILPEELAIAARFSSNSHILQQLNSRSSRLVLDYYDDHSKAQFLQLLRNDLTDLSTCVMWLHSPAHGFSLQVIEALSQRAKPPLCIHLFGCGASGKSAMQNHANRLGVPYTAITLESISDSNGQRWLTHEEISGLVVNACSRK